VEGSQAVIAIDNDGFGRWDFVDGARANVRSIRRQAYCFELGSWKLDDVRGDPDLFRHWDWGIACWE
jgi:hypothetical protein